MVIIFILLVYNSEPDSEFYRFKVIFEDLKESYEEGIGYDYDDDDDV